MSKKLTEEQLEKRIDELDTEIKQKEAERMTLRDELYHYGAAKIVDKVIGKYVKLPGYYSTEDFDDDMKSEYRIFRINKLIRWCGGGSGYFKISNFVYVSTGFEHSDKCVRFLDSDDLKNYKISDVSACKILTDAQAKKEYEKINKFIQKEFDKIRK